MKKDNWKLGLHLMPPKGWLNDPNGLCWYKGEYHVFFQYSPKDPNGGLKHWGHYKSKDMLEWEFTGIPVKAEESYEKDGAYSGCAFVEDDVMHLFYTGNVKEEGDHDYINSGRGANIIHAVYTPEGKVVGKNCIMTNADYPENYTCHIRDPKVWKEDDQYYMLLGGRDKDDVGRVLVYTSTDLLTWSFLQDVSTQTPFGYMWECPDYFKLGEEKFLSVSPQGLKPQGHDYENVYQSGYFKVSGELTDQCELSDFTEWDQGFDFYAPQTFEDQKGRRILIGWMGIPDADYTNPTVERGWQHGLTIPRVLAEHGGIVYQEPIEELKQLRREKQQVEDGREMDFEVAELELINKEDHNFCIAVAQGMKLSYDNEAHCVELKFENDSNAGGSFTTHSLGAGRQVRHCDVSECRHVQMYLDRSAVEIYVNHGEKVITSRYYPADGVHTVKVSGRGCQGSLWNLDT